MVLKRTRKSAPAPGRFVTLLSCPGGGVLAEATAARGGVQCVVHELPEGASSTAAPSQLAPVVVGALREHRIRSRDLLLAVPRSKAVLKPLMLPPNTAEDEIAAMVQFQLQGEIPFPPEETILDFAVLRRDAEGVGVLAAAVQTSTVDHWKSLAEQAGLSLKRLTLLPSAIQHGLCSKEACEEKTIAMVTHLPGEMEIDVISRGTIQFSRSVTATATPEALATELIRSLRGYSAQHPDEALSKIVILGEAAHTLAAAAEETFSCEVQVEGTSLDDAMSLVCSGLACEASAKTMDAFNFLDPKKPVIKRDPKKIQATQLVAAVVLFLFGGIWLAGQYLDGLQSELTDLGVKLKATQDDEKLAIRLKKQLNAIEDWKEQELDILGHWANLSALLPGASDAYVGPLQPGTGEMSFTVWLRDGVDDDAQRIVDALQEAGYQPTVNKGTLDEKNSFGYRQRKEISILLTPGPVKTVLTEGNLARPADDDPTRSMQKRSSRSSYYRRGSGR